jgi:hypothetical protein
MRYADKEKFMIPLDKSFEKVLDSLYLNPVRRR